MKAQVLIQELTQKYSEWLEMAGDNSPALLIDIMANLLVNEREEKEFYKGMAYGRSNAK